VCPSLPDEPILMRLRSGTPVFVLTSCLSLLVSVPVAAQSRAAPVDTSGVGDGPFARMEMLYERTIFNVDVLQLDLEFGPETTATFSELVGEQGYDGEVADQVAEAAMASRDVLVRSRFLRDVRLDQFLDRMRDNLRNAREQGLLSSEEEATITRESREQYAVLDGRGIREGETMWYRIRGDSLHVAFETADGEILVEERPVGPSRRMAVLGGYLAEGSDFREKLVRSLFEGD